MLSSSGEGGGGLRIVMSPIVILTNETMFGGSWMLAFVEYRVVGRDETTPFGRNQPKARNLPRNAATPIRRVHAVLGGFCLEHIS